MKSDEIIESMRTKEKGSRTHKQKVRQLIKQLKKEHWYRLNSAKEYSVQLMKVFKNRLLKFL